MKVGEERLLVIPAHEGYGKNGTSSLFSKITSFNLIDNPSFFSHAGFPAWGIPPGGTLEFTLECLVIRKG
jgi:FKBP-type peptidyl-prolyl cis-trans isomerase